MARKVAPLMTPWRKGLFTAGGLAAAMLSVWALWTKVGLPSVATGADVKEVRTDLAMISGDYISSRLYDLSRTELDLLERLQRERNPELRRLYTDQLQRVREQKSYYEGLRRRFENSPRQQ